MIEASTPNQFTDWVNGFIGREDVVVKDIKVVTTKTEISLYYKAFIWYIQLIKSTVIPGEIID